ncbi:hypothetical protein DCAR_0417022 [Daucus carota subsp. sativus]|uniref:Proton pump-interactor 1 n=1 Tax=Daucus carota subsp. sativus TaxID=79200 RepID=A0AAF1AYW1_DAUCS|nr:PREDICTED: uncharacterized protein LOC108218450 [Daucus carota subsp. sativus]WOG97681.1 hypothetical protein DCAR_0417022 [Daucus carota subsp. sativus]
MMAGTGDDMVGLKGLTGGVELSSHQDLTQVGGDFGGTKIDFVDCKGNGNACGGDGGSYVFVSKVNGGGDPVGGGDCNVEVKEGVFLKDGDGRVGNGGVVVGIGGDDVEFAGKGNDHVLAAVMDKGGALHGELVVENGGVGVVGDGQADCEVKVEDQGGLKDESGVGLQNGEVVVGDGRNGREVEFGDQVGLKDKTCLGLQNGKVVFGDGRNDREVEVGLKGKTCVELQNGEVVAGDGRNDREVEVENQVSLKDKSVVGLEHGEVVVGDGRSDREVEVEDQVGLKDESGVGVENGEVVVGNGRNDCEGEVKDQVGLKDESGVEVENREGVVGVGDNDQDYLKEENNCGLSTVTDKDVALHGELFAETGSIGEVEDGQPACEVKAEDQADFESTTEPIENQESLTDTDREFGERKGEVIGLVLARELPENSVKSVEQNVVLPSADIGENKKSEAVVFWADGCELAKVEHEYEVDVGEGQMKRTEKKLPEESLEPQISVTSSVDCVSSDVGKDQAKLEQINYLANDVELREGKVTVMKSAEDDEISDNCARAVQQDVIVSPAVIGQKSDTVVLDAVGCKPPKVESGTEFGSVDRKPEEQAELESGEDNLRSQMRITESVDCLFNELEDGDKFKTEKDLDWDIEGGIQLNNDINAVANKGISMASADDYEGSRESIDESQTVNKLDSTPSNAGSISSIEKVPVNCGEGINAGTNDGATVELEPSGFIQVTNGDGTMTNESLTLQTNLDKQIGSCANSLELNRNSDDAQCNGMVMQAQGDGGFQSDSNGSAGGPEVGNLAFPVTEKKSELETKNLDSEDVKTGSATTGTHSDISDCVSSRHSNDGISAMKIEFGTFDSAELLSKSSDVDVLSKSQISDGESENTGRADLTMNSGSDSYVDMNFKTGVQYHSDVPAKDATVAESKVPSGPVNVGPAPLLDSSSSDSVNGQNLGFVAKAKPFQFLVRLPRFDDDKLRQQIKDAQLLVDEKTSKRDDIRREIDMKKAKLQSINYKYEATKSDERAARRSVKLKRQEIDSIQDDINRVKNSISVIDITNRIAHMEHMIEHETNPLKEEKQLLREINTLRKLRDQISSNVCPADEVNQAFGQIEPMEMQLKTLKRDLSDLKAKVSDAEAAVILLGKEYNGESIRLKELQAQFRAVNDVRQDAYKYFSSLKRQLHEKSKNFWMYKDEAKAANDYALSGNKEALYRLCSNQVETFMDLWNKNDKFREDYVRCNNRSTLRRLKTLDGRSLGIDEEAPVIPMYVGEKEEMQQSTPLGTTYPSLATNLKQENSMKPVKSEQVDGKARVVAEPKNKILKDKTSVKPISGSGSVLNIVSDYLEDVKTKEEVKQQTEEELELARKAEMVREEEIAAKLKEKIRQEERAKAQEALERKKRNAEKAQMRAMLRAQKEAEQKEKDKEKRQRKKEKKNTDGETGLEVQTESIKEERTDSPGTQPKKSSQVNKYSKPKPAAIPPALRNRGKRHYCKQLMWWILAILIVLFMFLVANGSTQRKAKPVTRGDRFPGDQWQPI